MPIASNRNVQTATLAIAADKVCYIIVKARAFDAKEAETDPGSGSNPTDDNEVDVLESSPDDPVYRELGAFINSLDEEEQINLVALAWLGRGTYEIGEWSDALGTARDEHNNRTAQYLLGLPLLGDYLEQGLDAFDLGCNDYSASLH